MTFFNSGSALSIGVFFSLMVIGLASSLPATLSQRPRRRKAFRPSVADELAALPPVGILFAAFLGINPIAALLGPTGCCSTRSRRSTSTTPHRHTTSSRR